MAIPNDSNQQKQKKKGSGVWGLLILAVIWAINRLDADDVSRFFSRLKWRFRTGNFRLDGAAIGEITAIVIGIVLIITLFVTLSRIKKVNTAKRFDGIKARRGGTTEAHSHDRLQGYRGDESGMEHWKKQLDGFLAAGIIDRSEYRALLERRRR